MAAEGGCVENEVSSDERRDKTPPIGSALAGKSATECVSKNSMFAMSESGGKSFRTADVMVNPKAVVWCTVPGKRSNAG